MAAAEKTFEQEETETTEGLRELRGTICVVLVMP
jgi:hypothetical protein